MSESRIREGLTFDDVLLVPGASEVLPAEVDLKTRFTRELSLNIPLVSAAMDTVTEHETAICMAQNGGIGIVHKNLSVSAQAGEIDKVKRSESGMIVDPITMHPEQRIYEALEVMARYKISGVPGDPRGQGRRHPHQSRPALRSRHAPRNFERDDDGEPRHRPAWYHPGASQGAAPRPSDRKAPGGGRVRRSLRADHDQGHREERALPQRFEGHDGPLAVRGGGGRGGGPAGTLSGPWSTPEWMLRWSTRPTATRRR